MSSEDDGGLPGSPGCPLGGTPWPVKGVYRHSCSTPPKARGHPSYFGNREELVRVLGDSCPTLIFTQRPLVYPAWTEPRVPQCPQLVAAGPKPVWPRPQPFYRARSSGRSNPEPDWLIFNPRVHPRHPIGPAGGALGRILQ